MIDKIYKLFLDELNFIESSSYFAHQEMKNADDCGGLVEIAIRKFLSEVIGERFKITHGYIYSKSNKAISPQIDIIITDKLVSHTLKKFEYLDNMEIVPIEAVVGIFELKRTLKKQQLTNARDHLDKIVNFVPVEKNHPTRYLPGGIAIGKGQGIQISGGKHSNPIIGILGLLDENLENLPNEDIPWFVDIVFSFRGYLCGIKDPDKNCLRISACREKTNVNEHIFFSNYDNREKVLKSFVAYLIGYLNEVSGRTFNINDYFS